MRLRIVLTFALLVTGAVACSDDDDASSFCDDRSELQSSVESLADLDVVADGTDAIKADVESVQEALSALRTSGGDAISDEVDAVEGSLSSLQSDVEDASGVADKASAFVSGLADVQTSLQALASAASDTAESCD